MKKLLVLGALAAVLAMPGVSHARTAGTCAYTVPMAREFGLITMKAVGAPPVACAALNRELHGRPVYGPPRGLMVAAWFHTDVRIVVQLYATKPAMGRVYATLLGSLLKKSSQGWVRIK